MNYKEELGEDGEVGERGEEAASPEKIGLYEARQALGNAEG